MDSHTSDQQDLNELLRKYTADKTELKESLSDEEFDRMIFRVQFWYETVKKTGHAPNPSQELAAIILLSALEGLRNVRGLMHNRQSWEAAEHGQQESLPAYLRHKQALRAQQTLGDKESWWASLKRFLAGFK